jgi:hypothetical protein
MNKDTRVEALKKDLRNIVQGKVMVRKSRSHRFALDEDYYDVYYAIPTMANKENILNTIWKHGFDCWQKDSRVVGGAYGYVFHTRIKKP